MKPTHSLFLAILLLAFTAASAFAQSGPSLLIKPWDGDQVFEFSGSALVPSQSSIKGAGDPFDIQVRQYEASGRGRLEPDDPRKISFGFDMTVLDFDESSDVVDTKIHRQVADQSVAAGMGVVEIDGWRVGVVAGLGFGYVGDDSEVTRAKTFYAKGDVIASYDLDEKSTLTFVLDYNRNRSILPDTPLPAVLYTHEVSPEFGYRLGVPENGLWWKPVEHLQLNLDYTTPFTVNADVSYELIPSLSLFGAFNNAFQGFLYDAQTRDRRLFFEQRRVEAGVQWKVIGEVDLVLAGGYVFGQKFSDGWDARDTDTIFKIGDAPYVRVGITANF